MDQKLWSVRWVLVQFRKLCTLCNQYHLLLLKIDMESCDRVLI
jgi:hypothetical protein